MFSHQAMALLATAPAAGLLPNVVTCNAALWPVAELSARIVSSRRPHKHRAIDYGIQYMVYSIWYIVYGIQYMV